MSGLERAKKAARRDEILCDAVKRLNEYSTKLAREKKYDEADAVFKTMKALRNEVLLEG